MALPLEPVPRPPFIYKILTHAEHASLQQTPEPTFLSALDTNDGFVHLSTRAQTQRTLDRFFGTANEVILLVIPYAKLVDSLEATGREVKWEGPEEATRFPHIYPQQSGKGILRSDVEKEVLLKRGDGWDLSVLDA